MINASVVHHQREKTEGASCSLLKPSSWNINIGECCLENVCFSFFGVSIEDCHVLLPEKLLA